MTAQTTATLECEVCGAGWGVSGTVLHFSGHLAALGDVFRAWAVPECPECGEEDAWDTVE